MKNKVLTWFANKVSQLRNKIYSPTALTRNAINGGQKGYRLGRRNGEPQRDTDTYPLLRGYGAYSNRQQILKPSTYNLRYFSRSPYVRRAINALRNPIKLNKWEIKPIDGVKVTPELQRQIDVATQCFLHPNNDDTFATLIDLMIDDWATFGAFVVEHQIGSDPIRPFWIWPVDAQSIFVFPAWTGDAREARYFQAVGSNLYGMVPDEGVLVRNDELIYGRANPTNDTPYGYGPVQVAFDTISRQLGTAAYAGNLATNAQPQNLLFLGKKDTNALNAFRAYWRNQIEGQGETPIIGDDTEPKVLKLNSGSDDALYLKYQEFIVREIATAFDLSPQNVGIERDVNRSQGEVSEDRDWDQAIKPLAVSIQTHFTREILHGRLGWHQLQFSFIGLDREDELNLADIYQIEYKNNSITPNEYRERTGRPRMESSWGDKVYADVQIAIDAARGAKVVDDPALTNLSDAENEKSTQRQIRVKSTPPAAKPKKL